MLLNSEVQCYSYSLGLLAFGQINCLLIYPQPAGPVLLRCCNAILIYPIWLLRKSFCELITSLPVAVLTFDLQLVQITTQNTTQEVTNIVRKNAKTGSYSG